MRPIWLYVPLAFAVGICSCAAGDTGESTQFPPNTALPEAAGFGDDVAQPGSDAGTIDALNTADAGDSAVDSPGSDDGAIGEAATDSPSPADVVVADAASDLPTTDAVTTEAAADSNPPVEAGEFELPASCTDNSECGPDAICEGARCICVGGRLPCGDSCCPARMRDLTLDTTGHSPEIGSDGAGNVYVLYKSGPTAVRLATITPAGDVSTEAVAASSGTTDDADLAVAPDGTLYVAIHQLGSGRSGTFTLYSRTPRATAFTTMSLLTGGVETFAYNAAVSISRAQNGNVYAVSSERSGDGTEGLTLTVFDAAQGLWFGRPAILRYAGINRSELFARTDGFFTGVHDTDYHERFDSFDPWGENQAMVAYDASTIYGMGETAGAMTDSGLLYAFANDTLILSDGSLSESITFGLGTRGHRSDIDMAVDADGNPALLAHSVTEHGIGLLVRMPHGGYVTLSWPESFFIPYPQSSNWMSLDLERVTSGNLAAVVGNGDGTGDLRYLEFDR